MSKPKINSRSLLAEVFDVDEKTIPDNINIHNYNLWDSLAHMRIILIIEEEICRTLTTNEIIEIIDMESIQNLLTLGYQNN